MPYGVDKSLGGDNKSNDKWMEHCVRRVQDSGKSKASAIAICKAQLQKSRASTDEPVFSDIDASVVARELVIRWGYIRKAQLYQHKTYAQAVASYESELAQQDFDLDRMVAE